MTFCLYQLKYRRLKDHKNHFAKLFLQEDYYLDKYNLDLNLEQIFFKEKMFMPLYIIVITFLEFDA